MDELLHVPLSFVAVTMKCHLIAVFEEVNPMAKKGQVMTLTDEWPRPCHHSLAMEVVSPLGLLVGSALAIAPAIVDAIVEDLIEDGVEEAQVRAVHGELGGDLAVEGHTDVLSNALHRVALHRTQANAKQQEGEPGGEK